MLLPPVRVPMIAIYRTKAPQVSEGQTLGRIPSSLLVRDPSRTH
jgi:hypothetical protein